MNSSPKNMARSIGLSDLASGLKSDLAVTLRSWPAIITRNVARWTSARCRTNPTSNIVDGSTERRAMASASRPEHFISSVRR